LGMDAESHLWIKDIQDHDDVRDVYLVKTKGLGSTKNGAPFLTITLADRTGDIAARVWDRAEALSTLFSEGDIIKVQAQATSYREQTQLNILDLQRSEEEADPCLFLESSPFDTAEMFMSLKKIISQIENSHLKILTDRFLSDRDFTSLFQKAPAAKNFHHNYIGGLLEHTLSVCSLILSITEHYPNLNRDLMIAGGFFHDIGKIREFKFSSNIDYTDEGRLLGHMIIGISMLDEKLAKIKAFPEETELRLKHLILSHHGEFEFGSPKRPKFLEAFALHQADDLDAKIKGLGRYMENDRKEGSWTDFNRMFERYFLKGGILEKTRQEKSAPVSPEESPQAALDFGS